MLQICFPTFKLCLIVQNSRNQGFSYKFWMMIEGSGYIPLTSGTGSGRPKNMWIRFLYPCLAMRHLRCVTVLCNVGFVHNTCSKWIFFSVPRLVQATWENCFGSAFSDPNPGFLMKPDPDAYLPRFSMTKKSTILQLKKMQYFFSYASTIKSFQATAHPALQNLNFFVWVGHF